MTKKIELKKEEIILNNNTIIKFPQKGNGKYGNMLICGNLNGVCGNLKQDDVTKKWSFDINDYSSSFLPTQKNNFKVFLNTIKSKSQIIVASSEETLEYFKHLICVCIDGDYLGENLNFNQKKKIFKKIRHIPIPINIYDEMIEKIFKEMEKGKFDTIIQNPPYDGTLHLDFLEKGIELLAENGRMVIVEPATWLINVRKNGKGKKYDEIKRKIEGHVESVVIENLNKEFNITQFVPCSIITIDMSKKFETIDFVCCGEHKTVKSLYDCNLIGDYKTIHSIINKVGKFGDFMKNHITKEDMGDNTCYSKYAEIEAIPLCQIETKRIGRSYETSKNLFQEHKFGNFLTKYSSIGYHFYMNEISNKPLCSYDRGKHLTDKIAENIYGKKEELENWKHFIFNNKLSLFLNIVLTIDQHNNSKEFLPWLVDKKYTDEEINEMFGFTDEEIKLIDTTLKKYERNSPWFKRYMCGVENSATNEEIQNFINEIYK